MRSRVGPMVDRLTLPKGLCMFDTEEKMLRGIEFLYPLTRKMPGFRENSRWSASSPVDEVFYNLLHQQYAFFRKHQIEFGFRINDQQYYFEVIIPVWMQSDITSLPVYFLPVIEQVRPGLFDFLFYLASFLFRRGVPFVNDVIDYEDGWIYEGLTSDLADLKIDRRSSGEDDERIAALERSLLDYSTAGEAFKFFNRVKKSGASAKKWLADYNDFKPLWSSKTPFCKAIHAILDTGKKLMEFPRDHVNNYSMLPEELRGDEESYDELPVLPYEYINMVWRLDDPWFSQYREMKQSEMDNQGAVPLYRKIEVRQPDDLNTSKKDNNNFPSLLVELIARWVSFERRFHHVLKDPVRINAEFNKNRSNLIDIL